MSTIVAFTMTSQKTSAEDGFTDVSFGQTKYHLPSSRYKIWVQQYDPKKDRAAFGFSVIAPTVDPSTSDPDESAKWGRGTGWHKQIHILVEYGYEFRSAQSSFEGALASSALMRKMQDTDVDLGKRVRRFEYLDPNRFETIQNGCKKYDGFAIAGNETLMCNTEDGLVYVACHPEKGVPLDNGTFWKYYPYCDVHVNVGERTALTYEFGYDYVNDFPDIHNHLLSLLRSFQSSTTKR